MRRVLVLILALAALVYAKSGADIAKELDVQAGTKAIKQWERIFDNEKRLTRAGIVGLSESELKLLKEYLIKHAADSDQPTIAGM